VVHPDDVPRFAELRVTANAQPFWACYDQQVRDLVVPFMGPERMAHHYPFRSLLASGATMSMGSDWDVSTPDVMKEIQVAVTRVPFDEPDVDVFFPEERLSLEQSLRAFTAGSAFVNHLDGDTGTLEEGKLADIVVLDLDPFDLPPEEIGQSKPVLTLIEGETVFEDGSVLA
jgi:predicted amidohydrolase YtcJ